MDLFGKHIVILNDAQHAIVAKALADAGHSVVTAGMSEIATLWAETKQKFPALVTDIETASPI